MKMVRVVISVVGVLSIFLLTWHTRANADIVGINPPAVLKHAERALQQDDPVRALALLQERMSVSARSAFTSDAHGMRCRALFMQGKYEQAEQACDAALKSGGNAIAWNHYNNRGVMRLMQGRYDAAIEDFRASLRRNPLQRAPRSNLDLALESQRKGGIATAP